MSEEQTPYVSSRYFYVSENPTEQHKGKVSAYFVERMKGDNIVARITPIGLLNESTQSPELDLYAIHHSLSIAGEWTQGKHSNHRHVRVVEGRF